VKFKFNKPLSVQLCTYSNCIVKVTNGSLVIIQLKTLWNS